jgi:cold-inducible RNA-binding protein
MNIYVGNLAPEVTEEELRQEFTAFGEVTSVGIIKDKYSSQSRGFGFIEMPSMAEGQAAISSLKGKVLKDRTLEVSEARPRSDKGSYRDQRGGGRHSDGGSYGGRSSSFGGGGKNRRY